MSQFNTLYNKLYHKKNVSPIEQKAGLLEAYKNWVYLNKFQIEFSAALISFCELVFGSTFVHSKIPNWAIKKLMNSQTLKEIYALTKGKHENWKKVLERAYSNNENTTVSKINIDQIFESDYSNNKQSFAKFQYRLDKIKRGNFEKTDLNDFLNTVEKLLSRVVGDVEQYQFKLKVFKSNPEISYKALKALRKIMAAWHDKRYGEVAEDEFEAIVYDRFEKNIVDEFLRGKLSNDKALAASLDAVFYYLETGLETPFQLTQLNENFFRSLNRSSEDKASKYSRINSCYLVQLWAEKADRLNSVALPTLTGFCFAEKKIEASVSFNRQLKSTNENLFTFLNQPLSDCLFRIHSFLDEPSSNDELLSKLIFENDIELSELKDVINEELFKSELSLKHSTGLTVDELYSLASYHSPLEASTIFKTSVLVHLLILKNQQENAIDTDLIRKAFKCEESILLNSVFLHFNFYRTFGEDIRFVLTEQYRDFKSDILSFTKAIILLCFVKKAPTSDIHRFIDENLSIVFGKPFPISNKQLICGVFNGEVKAILKSLNISIKDAKDFPFREVLETDFNDIEQSSYFKSCNQNRLTELVFTLNNKELLEQAWIKVIGSNDKEVLFYSYVAHFLNSDSKGVTELVNKNRRDVKNDFKGKYFHEYLKSITNKAFDKKLLGFDESLSAALNSKLEVVSNIISLGDERFRLVYDSNSKPVHLGSGGFGCVYKAEDTILESIVAVKLLPKWDESIYLEKKLLKEAVLMRQCHHENVLTLFDVHAFKTDNLAIASNIASSKISSLKQDSKIYGLITEYPKASKTLAEFNVEDLSFEKKCQILIQLCGAIAEIHSHGLIHGDIKPTNILCDEQLKIKLLDFGSVSEINKKVWACTKSPFLSPNALSEGEAEELDDLYSIGVLVIYLVNPELINWLWGIENKCKNHIFASVYLIIEHWDYCAGKSTALLSDSRLGQLLSENSSLFNGLQKFLIFNESEKIDLLKIAIQLLAPSSFEQEIISRNLLGYNESDSNRQFDCFYGYKKLKNATCALNCFLRLGENSKILEPKDGLMLYGKSLSRGTLDNVECLDIFKPLSYPEISPQDYLFKDKEIIDFDKHSFNFLNNKLSFDKESIWKVDSSNPFKAEVIYLWYKDESINELILSCDVYNVFNNDESNIDETISKNKHINIGRAPFREPFFRTIINFEPFKNEIELLTKFYLLNKALLERLGVCKRPLVRKNIGRYDSYSHILSCYKAIFIERRNESFYLDDSTKPNLKSICEIQPNNYSVYSDIFLKYKKAVDELVDSYIDDLNAGKYFVISNELSFVFTKFFYESKSESEFINRLSDDFSGKELKCPIPFLKYIWKLYSQGNKSQENGCLPIIGQNSKTDKYDAFLSEIINHPDGEYVRKLRNIQVAFNEESNWDLIWQDLNLISRYINNYGRFFTCYTDLTAMKNYEV